MTANASSRVKYVVISSRLDDVHIPLVEKHLDQPFVIADWTEIPQGSDVSYRLGKYGFELEWNGVILNKVKSVWYRKPTTISKYRFPLKSDEMVRYAAQSLSFFNELLLAHFADVYWI